MARSKIITSAVCIALSPPVRNQVRDAEDSVRALVFERGELNQFFRNEAEVAGLIYQLLGRELAQKLRARNIDISEAALGRHP